MAYNAPSTRNTSDLITATIWNADVVANPIAIYAGEMSMDSQAAGDIVYASSGTQLARVSIGTTNKVLTSNGSIPAWVTQIANSAMPTNVDLAGTLDVTGDTTLDGDLTVSGTGPHGIGFAPVDYIRLAIGGNYTSGGSSTSLYGIWNSSALTGHADDSSGISGMRLDTTAVTAGNATLVSQLNVNEPQITVGSGTVTNSATVYIQAAASEATNNYALWVDAGATQLDSTLTVGGATTLDSTLTVGGALSVAKDTDIATYFGKGFISSTATNMTADRAHFGHVDCENGTDYALVQTAAGATTLNCKTGTAMWFGINAGALGNWSSTGFSVGVAGTGSTAAEGTLHVHTASAGAVTFQAASDDLIVEHSNHGGITIATPDNKEGSLMFLGPTAGNLGLIAYDQASPGLQFHVTNSQRMLLTATKLTVTGEVEATEGFTSGTGSAVKLSHYNHTVSAEDIINDFATITTSGFSRTDIQNITVGLWDISGNTFYGPRSDLLVDIYAGTNFVRMNFGDSVVQHDIIKMIVWHY